MQFNLSVLYSIILFILFSILTIGNAGAASIDFDSLQHSEIVKTQFPGVSIRAGNFRGRPDLAIIFDRRKRSTDFQDAVYANNTINRIQPITAADVSVFDGNPQLTKFDRVGINFGGSAAVDNTRSHLKNVFWPNIFVGASFQILDIQQYASGLKLGSAAILNQNPIFKMASRFSPVPEPASMLLVGSGLIVLAGIGRRKMFKKKK